MKKIIICLLSLLLVSITISAQTQEDNKRDSIEHARDSVITEIAEIVNDMRYRMHGLDRYKLYKTENLYNLLRLDTMTGKIEQVQWSLDENKEGTFTINARDLSFDTGCGTFELYPTQNMYQFILLNKVDGRMWHVQWGIGDSKRWIKRIY